MRTKLSPGRAPTGSSPVSPNRQSVRRCTNERLTRKMLLPEDPVDERHRCRKIRCWKFMLMEYPVDGFGELERGRVWKMRPACPTRRLAGCTLRGRWLGGQGWYHTAWEHTGWEHAGWQHAGWQHTDLVRGDTGASAARALYRGAACRQPLSTDRATFAKRSPTSHLPQHPPDTAAATDTNSSQSYPSS